MKIELKLFASLAGYKPKDADLRIEDADSRIEDADSKPNITGRNDPGMIDVKEGITVGDLLKQLDLPENLVKIVFLNGVHAKDDDVLKDGDRLGVFPPVAGG